MTVNLKDPNELAGKPVLGTGDSKLGKVEEVCLDNETNKLEWASIKTGMFGGHVSLVPLANAEFDGSTLRVPYDKELLKAAPHTDPGQDLSPGSGTTIMCRMTPLSGNPIRTGLTGQDRQRAPLTCGPPERPSASATPGSARTTALGQVAVAASRSRYGTGSHERRLATATRSGSTSAGHARRGDRGKPRRQADAGC